MINRKLEILESARVLIENRAIRHICNAIRLSMKYHDRNTTLAERNNADELISIVMSKIYPHPSLESYLCYAGELDDDNMNDPNVYVPLRLKFLDKIIEEIAQTS